MTFQSIRSILRKETLLPGRAFVGTWGRGKATPQLRLSIPVRYLAGVNQKTAHPFLPSTETLSSIPWVSNCLGQAIHPSPSSPSIAGLVC